MPHHVLTFGSRQSLLGKRREHIRIGMGSPGLSGPQAVVHDFGYVRHVFHQCLARALMEHMSDVPKIVHDRLRAGEPGGAHPDADVLTAFAEQALSGAEREDVVRHLSRCGDCREVVALSIPPMEAVAQAKAARDGVSAAGTSGGLRAWFAWPNLRWAAMAAAVVVVASVLVLRPGKQNQSLVEIANQQAEKTSPSTDTSAKPATPLADQATPAGASPTKPDKSLAREARATRMIAPEPGRVQTQIPAGTGARLADNKRADSLEDKRNYSFGTGMPTMKAPAAAAASAKGGIVASEHSEHKIGSSTETVEVTAADAVVQPAPMEDTLMGSNMAVLPIETAKPAAKEEAQLKSQAQAGGTQNKLAAAYSKSDTSFGLQKQRSKQSKDVIAQWSLAQGRLERSLDAGATWQIALQLQHPLLSFGARGSDVWAGGQTGTLFHST